MRLPEAVLLDAPPPGAQHDALHAHAAAWRMLLASNAAWALVIQRGVLLATTLRESLKALVADASARQMHMGAAPAEWRIVHLLAVTNQPHLEGTSHGSLLRVAPIDAAGAPAYLLSRHGAAMALAQCDARGHADVSGPGDAEEALYATLGQGHGCYACARVVALVADDGSAEAASAAPVPTTQRELVSQLTLAGCFALPGEHDTKLAVACMVALDRARFAPAGTPAQAVYRDAPLHLPGTVMSAPSSHARAAATLLPAVKGRAAARVLDIGAGSGYVSALLALLIAATGSDDGGGSDGGGGDGHHERARVVVLERDDALAQSATAAATAALLATSLSGRHAAAEALVAVGADGRDGYPPLAPYDAIYVGGSCACVPPALVAQLAVGGRLLLAVGESDAPQDLTLVERHADDRAGEPRVRQTVLVSGTMMYGLR